MPGKNLPFTILIIKIKVTIKIMPVTNTIINIIIIQIINIITYIIIIIKKITKVMKIIKKLT